MREHEFKTQLHEDHITFCSLWMDPLQCRPNGSYDSRVATRRLQPLLTFGLWASLL